MGAADKPAPAPPCCLPQADATAALEKTKAALDNVIAKLA